MPDEAIVPKQIDAICWSDIEIDVLQIQQSSKPHAGFHITCLHRQNI